MNENTDTDRAALIAELDGATNEFRRAEQALAAARERAHAAIAAALHGGIGPSETARHAPYDRVHVDRIRREAGIPNKR